MLNGGLSLFSTYSFDFQHLASVVGDDLAAVFDRLFNLLLRQNLILHHGHVAIVVHKRGWRGRGGGAVHHNVNVFDWPRSTAHLKRLDDGRGAKWVRRVFDKLLAH